MVGTVRCTILLRSFATAGGKALLGMCSTSRRHAGSLNCRHRTLAQLSRTMSQVLLDVEQLTQQNLTECFEPEALCNLLWGTIIYPSHGPAKGLFADRSQIQLAWCPSNSILHSGKPKSRSMPGLSIHAMPS